MSGGTHLELEERERLAALKAEGLSLRAIARALGRAASTVSRELRRNALPKGGYLPVHAEGCYQRVEESRLQPGGSGMAVTTSIAVSAPVATARTTSTAPSTVSRASRWAEAPATNSRGVPAPTSRRMTRPRL